MIDLQFTPLKDEYWIIKPPAPLPYISATAVKRVRDKIDPPTCCPLCNGPVALVVNSEIYGRPIGDWPYAYSCQSCGEAYVGLHPDTDIPLGTMAGKDLRTARQQAKTRFNELTHASGKSRHSMYRWLSSKLKLPLSETHFGLFDMSTAIKVKLIIEEKFFELKSE